MDKAIQKRFFEAIDRSIVDAARVMELGDIPEPEDDAGQDLHDSAYEERFHCGTCIVGTVMETVWNSIDEYMQYLEGLVDNHEKARLDAYNKVNAVIRSVDKGSIQPLIEALAILNSPPDVPLPKSVSEAPEPAGNDDSGL